jgi:hypothetical protein
MIRIYSHNNCRQIPERDRQMKFVKLEILIDQGDFSKSKEWDTIFSNIKESIEAVRWPAGASTFSIHKQSGKKRGEGSVAER